MNREHKLPNDLIANCDHFEAECAKEEQWRWRDKNATPPPPRGDFWTGRLREFVRDVRKAVAHLCDPEPNPVAPGAMSVKRLMTDTRLSPELRTLAVHGCPKSPDKSELRVLAINGTWSIILGTDDTVPRAIVRHVAHCPFCGERLRSPLGD